MQRKQEWGVLGVGIVAGAWTAYRVYGLLTRSLKRGGKSSLPSRKVVLHLLQQALSHELDHVRLYEGWQESLSDNEQELRLLVALKQVTTAEQGHTGRLIQAIRQLGGIIEPPEIHIEQPAPLPPGDLTGLFSAIATLENQSVTEYRALADRLSNTEWQEVILTILVEEEFHAAWAQEQLSNVSP